MVTQNFGNYGGEGVVKTILQKMGDMTKMIIMQQNFTSLKNTNVDSTLQLYIIHKNQFQLKVISILLIIVFWMAAGRFISEIKTHLMTDALTCHQKVNFTSFFGRHLCCSVNILTFTYCNVLRRKLISVFVLTQHRQAKGQTTIHILMAQNLKTTVAWATAVA
jgi:hypothetical protein